MRPVTHFLVAALGTASFAGACADDDPDAAGGAGGTTPIPASGGHGGGAACADPGYDLCDGVCTYLGTDAMNCGRCGRDCFGGMCVGSSEGSICTPVVLAEGGDVLPHGPLAQDDANLYWSTSPTQCAVPGTCETITRIAKQGPASGYTTVAVARGTVYGVAVDDSGVYWTSLTSPTHSVLACPGQTCGTFGQSPVTIAADRNMPRHIVLGDGALYWSEGTLAQSVFTCPTSGCAGAPSEVFPSNEVIHDLAIDDDRLYVAAGPRVNTCSLPDCAGGATAFVNMPDQVVQVAIDGTDVLFATATSIYVCPATGCAGMPVPLATLGDGYPAPSSLMGDGSSVYLSTGGALMRCAYGGCNGTPETFNPEEQLILNMIVDDTAAYYIAAMSVKKIAK